MTVKVPTTLFSKRLVLKMGHSLHMTITNAALCGKISVRPVLRLVAVCLVA